MTRDALSASFQDALAFASADPVRIAAHLRSRTNGADLEHLLIAAIDIAREQARQIAELKESLQESEGQNTFLEEEIDELRRRINCANNSSRLMAARQPGRCPAPMQFEN